MAKKGKPHSIEVSTYNSCNKAAKQAIVKRSKKTSKSQPMPFNNIMLTIFRQLIVIVLVTSSLIAFLLLVAPFLSVTLSGTDVARSDTGISGGSVAAIDPARLNETRDFLTNFVCHYEPSPKSPALEAGERDARNPSIKGVDIRGYCHPRLIAMPHERTQIVSTSAHTITATSITVKVTQEVSHRWEIIMQWWETIISDGTMHETYPTGISSGELVMTLPRPLQIWDLDALRDQFIQQEFLGLSNENDSAIKQIRSKRVARHNGTQNPLDSGAFLAVYLLRLLQGSHQVDSQDGACKSSDIGECRQFSNNLQPQWNDLNYNTERRKLLLPYLNIMPTYSDRIAKASPSQFSNPHDHPLTWSSSTLESLFPQYTHTYDLIQHYQQMVESEYKALKLTSPDEFGKKVNYSEYLGMRINVLSRAFGVSASDKDKGAQWEKTNAQNEKRIPLNEEMTSYTTSNFGALLKNESPPYEIKLRAMCPLLDMYNSHPRPNVSWRYSPQTSSFDIHASNEGGVPQGHSIVVSYGKYTEGHLFAKYGYVNGDGSSPTEANLAVFHRVLGDVGLGRQYSQLPFDWDSSSFDGMNEKVDNTTPESKQSILAANKATEIQRELLLRYLMFDDGYEECIKGNSEHWELKLLKLQHLIRIANFRDAWIIRLPPRHPDARPGDTISTMNGKNGKESAVGVDAKRVLSTCRLLSMTVDDMDGKAIDFLKEGLAISPHSSSSSFKVKMHGEALEYRAMMCIARLCNVALNRYGDYAKPKGNDEPTTVGNREWTAWYIRDGEMRVLNILRQTAVNEANRLKRQSQLSVGFTVRENGACPLEYSMALLDAV